MWVVPLSFGRLHYKYQRRMGHTFLRKVHITQNIVTLRLGYEILRCISGCNTQSSGNPLPTECNVCRVAKDKTTGSCLPECPPEKYLTADKLCLDLSGTLTVEIMYQGGRDGGLYCRKGKRV